MCSHEHRLLAEGVLQQLMLPFLGIVVRLGTMNVNGPHIDAAISQIGARLKRIRTQRNVTLTALSESTGISKSTLSRLEAGGASPELGVAASDRACPPSAVGPTGGGTAGRRSTHPECASKRQWANGIAADSATGWVAGIQDDHPGKPDGTGSPPSARRLRMAVRVVGGGCGWCWPITTS